MGSEVVGRYVRRTDGAGVKVHVLYEGHWVPWYIGDEVPRGARSKRNLHEIPDEVIERFRSTKEAMVAAWADLDWAVQQDKYAR